MVAIAKRPEQKRRRHTGGILLYKRPLTRFEIGLSGKDGSMQERSEAVQRLFFAKAPPKCSSRLAPLAASGSSI